MRGPRQCSCPAQRHSLKHLIANWHEIAYAVIAVLIIAAAAVALKFGRGKDSAEIERERRSYVNRVGRIVDGQVLEIVEKASDADAATGATLMAKRHRKGNAGNHRLLLYTYSISGVTYEAAQDITGLEERACLERVVAGQPVGVKYDPANPGNSILLADDWSGLS